MCSFMIDERKINKSKWVTYRVDEVSLFTLRVIKWHYFVSYDVAYLFSQKHTHTHN